MWCIYTKHSRPEKAIIMVRSTSLPPELWDIILGLLSPTDIKQLTLVHSTLYARGRPFLWKTVNLCTLRKSDRVKARAIIQNPALGSYIKHLRLKPTNYEQRLQLTWGLGQYIENPTNIRTRICDSSSSIKTWADVAKLIDWKHPTRGFWNFRISRKTAELAVQVASYLTEVRKITFQPGFYEEALLPDPRLYHQIFRNIRPNQVRCLDLDFCSGSAVQLFGKVVRELQLTFELLDTLILRITVHHDVVVPWDFKSDIQVIADMGRVSLQSLEISWSVKPTLPSSSLGHLLDSLGFFPRLRRFNFTWYNSNRNIDQILIGFIQKHHTTLSHLGFGHNLNELFTLLLTLTNSRQKLHMPNLSSIGLMNRNTKWPLLTFTTVQPKFSFYANTLTTLIIEDQYRIYPGLTYQDVFELVSSLDSAPGHHRPGGSSCLRRLKIPIRSLSPEVFDIMSNHLRSLLTLDITYMWLVGHKDEDSSVNQNSKALFWREMRFRQYPDWGVHVQTSIQFLERFQDSGRITDRDRDLSDQFIKKDI
ncbi:hypothetical protein BDN72DRAFT_925921 [Pluteus cervinus]|uniref:Uncharacterized protein n=1 Tax=Pluteus cervinus TaxID=181527 RepID=A0ACD3AFP6_9AGAR|nr:hypothetical protein BDN72DRAFT_925921 [Pluteus cervinus]